ncbi:unnamed protein product [Paramecium pentaurelia]|uniref:Uncharacterized protein n=1 Tax=Paramecium pentaurelia TaxID=43138 RepID=A0A8S1UVQ2_9CILI|nr:unnamed protein product [Paramecium pentaurelia]
MIISNMIQNISRVSDKMQTETNSIIYSLNKFKRSSLKNRNYKQYQEDFINTNEIQLRRKSCYCSECGQLSQFQYKHINNYVQIKKCITLQKNQMMSKSMKIIPTSNRSSILIQRHQFRMNTCREIQQSHIYNISPARLTSMKENAIVNINKNKEYYYNELLEQIKKKNRLHFRQLSVPQTKKEQEPQLIKKHTQTSSIHRKQKPDIRPYFSHLKLKPINQKFQTSHFEI